MNLLCIAVDRLHIGYLGCYGSTWVATPAFDRLASTGFVFDQAHVDSLDRATTYDSLWRGSHVLERTSEPGSVTFAETARRIGVKTLLAADDAVVLQHAAGAAWDDILELPSPPSDAGPASDADATFTARTFAAFSRRWAECREPFAAWFHTSALAGPWDAPASFRERYRDDEDPPIPTFTTLVSRTLPSDVDLDDRFAVALAYAAQVSLLDICLGGLLEQLEETGLHDRTAVVVVGMRGLALGEHLTVGFDDERLYAENVHVPLLMRLPGGRGALRRTQALVQPCDLLPTIAELWGTPGNSERSGFGQSLIPWIDGTAKPGRDRAAIVGCGETTFRTPNWSLRIVEPAAGDDGRAELFVKPDDFWEVNDVADRCRDAVVELSNCARETFVALTEGRELPSLPPTENLLTANS